MEGPLDFSKITGFQWDRGNRDKNWEKHAVNNSECEEAFFNIPFLVATDNEHSRREKRYYALGRTHEGRMLFIVFTLRGEKIRVISARDMSRKERLIYENIKKNTQIQE